MPRILFNRWLPFPGYSAMNLFGIILVRRGVQVNRCLINHELIHTRQQAEMLFVFFYLWYVAEWLVRLVRLRNVHRAYRAISLEREAYRHELDLTYLSRRRPFAWTKEL